MTDLVEHMRQTLRLAIIQRAIFCPLTNVVLDIRTARFILDADGDPYIALSPEGAAQFESDLASGERTLADGYTLEAAR
ncbi:hypothetical protein PBI_TEAMOCIL_10 [Microbacterium phage Teamocil]|uniref:Uncharacterized protein n=1 Tax=Microbacterium phage Teamocil TaxID=2656554 RepID=A0A649VYC3_9CAUD|nr:hypothetical protein QDA12_gp10 [Microbacterium phage Teamocil]QGJ88865.1 hypothetical protein PBI_GINA_10 [Microbacterium phage Gina]QGJ96962.1 hypothetical protein PBI_TEAMOCIL_10 [Microbacterium phage Teamocil]